MAKNLLVNNELLLYGDVGDPFGWGDGFSPEDVARSLAEHGFGDLTVRLNSGGGIATDGMAIYSLLKSRPSKTTMTIDGVAASAASLIAMAGSEIEMRDGAMMMIHDPASITIGPAKTHEDAAARLHKLADNYASVYAQRSGKDAKDVRDLMLATTWFTADEAIANGFATRKADDKPIAMAQFDYRMYASAPDGLPCRRREPLAREEGPAPVSSAGTLALARMRGAMARFGAKI